MSLSGFASPWWFLLLIVVAGVAAEYVYVQRRRRKNVVRFTNLELLEKVAPRRQGRWRHAPAAVLGAALIVFTIALAGPTAEQKVPRNRAVVALVIDSSQSMKATDVKPSRIETAKVAAKSFVRELNPGANLGIISFAGSAIPLVSPTTDRAAALRSIDGLRLADSTATGDAIFSALQMIKNFGEVVSGPDGPPPARIVLMSDGKQTVPTDDPDDSRGGFTAAKQAKKANVPISTISFGTEHGTVDINGSTTPVPVDDDSLREIAGQANGNFYKAANADELKKVYDTIGEQIGYETRVADASRPWLIAGTVLFVIGLAGAVGLNQRIP
ncbi:VWA domain-containing protein [Amycolatopsis sp. CA-230715]|uniref:VWA domain-containing protein n=1 Tax=Amycolatopsis sp. CA-230715 TaxID=2745196 RepID=UPI001C035F2F|nr:VWA domain-containing protein [Amycolatopsis sp. CA-230715]QWF79813.1 hypothetical protein HUW46_03226 [Amycolatopsis sp. CA-230715]